MKKSMKALLLAMVLVVVPVASFAAPSPDTSSSSSSESSSGGSSSSSDSGDSSSDSNSDTSYSTTSRDNSSNASSHHSSGGGGGSSSSSSSSSSTVVAGNSSSSTGSGIVETKSTTVTNAQGKTWNVGATYTRLNDGVVTALLGGEATDEIEEENPSTAYVAVSESKLAGLPEYVKTILGQADWGDLSAVPGVDLTGYKSYGTTIAVRSEAGSTATIYCSELPESGAKILFYNNWTQTWSLLDCSVDAETGTVTFTVPTSGHALIVGE